MRGIHRLFLSGVGLLGAALLLLALASTPARGCTGITLIAGDGSVVFARTLEWGAFDLNSRVMIVPRGQAFAGEVPGGGEGLRWRNRHGYVAIDGLEDGTALDGMNERGLAVGLFYHPGVAEYAPYDPAEQSRSLGPADISNFLLGMCASVEEVREVFARVRVVPTVEEALGFPAPIHLFVIDPSGDRAVIEFIGGEVVMHAAPLGVITNAPSYDWHMINLRNYINLSPVAVPAREAFGESFAPLGAGSGMIGLPGDFTPPSRFVRAVAFSQTARPTATGAETMHEAFRILDNFNVPLGAAEGSDDDADDASSADEPDPTAGMRSATLWTTVQDTTNRVMYYHTQHNRRVRMVDLKRIDFGTLDGAVFMPLDRVREQDVLDVTPGG